MKVAVTCNLGNYESLRIESNESADLKTCFDDVRQGLLAVNTPQTNSYINRILSHYEAFLSVVEVTA